ncbi:hypothetical protein PFISCL1PPCAC_3229, partial [Pristionchus fissidentatus]
YQFPYYGYEQRAAMEREVHFSLYRIFTIILYLVPFLYTMCIVMVLYAVPGKKPLSADERNNELEFISKEVDHHVVCCTLVFLLLQQPVLFAISLAIDIYNLWLWFVTKLDE